MTTKPIVGGSIILVFLLMILYIIQPLREEFTS